MNEIRTRVDHLASLLLSLERAVDSVIVSRSHQDMTNLQNAIELLCGSMSALLLKCDSVIVEQLNKGGEVCRKNDKISADPKLSLTPLDICVVFGILTEKLASDFAALCTAEQRLRALVMRARKSHVLCKNIDCNSAKSPREFCGLGAVTGGKPWLQGVKLLGYSGKGLACDSMTTEKCNTWETVPGPLPILPNVCGSMCMLELPQIPDASDGKMFGDRNMLAVMMTIDADIGPATDWLRSQAATVGSLLWQVFIFHAPAITGQLKLLKHISSEPIVLRTDESNHRATSIVARISHTPDVHEVLTIVVSRRVCVVMNSSNPTTIEAPNSTWLEEIPIRVRNLGICSCTDPSIIKLVSPQEGLQIYQGESAHVLSEASVITQRKTEGVRSEVECKKISETPSDSSSSATQVAPLSNPAANTTNLQRQLTSVMEVSNSTTFFNPTLLGIRGPEILSQPQQDLLVRMLAHPEEFVMNLWQTGRTMNLPPNRDIFRAIISVYVAHQQVNAVLIPLIRNDLKTTHSDVTTLFRSNSPLSALASEFFGLTGSAYLLETLEPCLQFLADQLRSGTHYEIFPGMLNFEPENWTHLQAACQMVVDQLFASAPRIPIAIRLFLRAAAECVASEAGVTSPQPRRSRDQSDVPRSFTDIADEKYNASVLATQAAQGQAAIASDGSIMPLRTRSGSKTEMVDQQGVAFTSRFIVPINFFFLRFVCPALIPDSHDMKMFPDPTSAQSIEFSRAGVLVSKCVQNLANLKTFKQKEFAVMDAFVRRNLSRMILFHETLCTGRNQEEPVLIPTKISYEDLQVALQEILLYEKKITLDNSDHSQHPRKGHNSFFSRFLSCGCGEPSGDDTSASGANIQRRNVSAPIMEGTDIP